MTRQWAEDMLRAADLGCCGPTKNAPVAQLDKAADLPWELSVLFQFEAAFVPQLGGEHRQMFRLRAAHPPARRPLTYVNGEGGVTANRALKRANSGDRIREAKAISFNTRSKRQEGRHRGVK